MATATWPPTSTPTATPSLTPTLVPMQIAFGQAVNGSLATGERSAWVFDGSANQVISIEMRALGGSLDPYLRLLDPDGREIVSNDDSGSGGNALIREYVLPRTGKYNIVTSDSIDFSAGSYSLMLELVAVATPTSSLTPTPVNSPTPFVMGMISFGETVSGVVESGGQHSWNFSGVKGQVITISLKKDDSDLDAYLVLLGPDGKKLVDNDDGNMGRGNSLIVDYILPETGTYTIIARGYGSTSGAYRLLLISKQTP